MRNEAPFVKTRVVVVVVVVVAVAVRVRVAGSARDARHGVFAEFAGIP